MTFWEKSGIGLKLRRCARCLLRPPPPDITAVTHLTSTEWMNMFREKKIIFIMTALYVSKSKNTIGSAIDDIIGEDMLKKFIQPLVRAESRFEWFLEMMCFFREKKIRFLKIAWFWSILCFFKKHWFYNVFINKNELLFTMFFIETFHFCK